ncbi:MULTISPECIES: LemA family protein [Anaerosinus]|uniref:LemA family protein n=1 Tax=Selenobaculum gibii TaxID=3054208 RepID=A0A9Y2AI00_9FIRM|nr:LemA family protein [Selenobaculum gbiensis]WIW70331.1 LemA family protein [Selenobaculum gbiensis]
MKGWTIFGVIAAIIIAIAAVVIMGYNGLVQQNEDVNSKWAQVENQLQRRADLIPNLVNTVKGYAAHEQEAIKAVSEARAKLAGAEGVANKSEANNELSSALSRLLMVVENYPNLKADQNFRALQDELAGTENRLAVARKDYNDVVQSFNTKVKTIPTSIYAGMLGFSQREYFKADEASKQTPQVKF